MGGLFSKGQDKRKEEEDHDMAVLKLKGQRDDLIKYKRKIQTVIDEETRVAKELALQGKRDRALLVLKRRKNQQKQLDNADQILANVQELVDDIEFAQVQARVVEGLKQGGELLKQLNEQTKIEDVELLMADTADAIEYQKEVTEALSGKLSNEDEESIAAELMSYLAAIEEEEAGTSEVQEEAGAHDVVADTGTSGVEEEGAKEEEEEAARLDAMLPHVGDVPDPALAALPDAASTAVTEVEQKRMSLTSLSL